MESAQFEELKRKIDIIIRLLALSNIKDLKTQSEKIFALSSYGFGPTEIAALIGTTPNTVSVTISKMKKKQKSEVEITNQGKSE